MRQGQGRVLAALLLGAGCGGDGGDGSGGAGEANSSTGGGIDFSEVSTSTSGEASGETTFGPPTTGPQTTTVDPDQLTSGCGEVTVTLEPVIPTIVLLIDQSGSMTADFGGQERWDAVYATLMDPTDGVVAQLESQVRFGVTLYTSEDGNDGGECPILTSVEAALDNRDAIDAAYAPSQPNDETPTGESLQAVATSLAALQAEGPKAIVLATDGEPDTCETPNPQEGQPEALAAAEFAFGEGISTFIISVGNDVGAEHLQQMANVGVGKDPDDANPAPYYEALDAAQLVDAFNEIVGSFISCDLVIDGEVDLEQACEGTVKLDGEELECGTAWDVPDETTLRLLGAACETLKDGASHTVDASWPCGAVVIP
ncbi:MAG: vWA domain-containing protein [Myxococcota bacterium]